MLRSKDLVEEHENHISIFPTRLHGLGRFGMVGSQVKHDGGGLLGQGFRIQNSLPAGSQDGKGRTQQNDMHLFHNDLPDLPLFFGVKPVISRTPFRLGRALADHFLGLQFHCLHQWRFIQ